MCASLFSGAVPPLRTQATCLALALLVSSLDLLTYITMILEDELISARRSGGREIKEG